MLSPELKLKLQHKIYELHINSSMGIDEKNIDKISLIAEQLSNIANALYFEEYGDVPPSAVINNKIEENDVTEASAELSAKVKAHRPESK